MLNIKLSLNPAFLTAFLAFLLSFFAFAQKAEAYVDPSTGSYILQLMAGAALTFLFTAKNIIRSIKSRFQKPENKEKNSSSAENELSSKDSLSAD
ncbi:MAG: hypothetical protein K2X27_09070 [Candidatus Obscuribacterales bacterium]|nr:hypothetical protein [Candidatus Obscuribacterales bacterium]